MATINNSDLSKELIKGAKIQLQIDKVPNQLAEKVVPVMEVNPRLLRNSDIIKDATKATTGPETIFATPTDKDFFLTAAILNIQADVASDSTFCALYVYSKGQLVTLLVIPKISLTVTTASNSISLFTPIKVDRGTNIYVTSTFTVGNQIISGNIAGYVVED